MKYLLLLFCVFVVGLVFCEAQEVTGNPVYVNGANANVTDTAIVVAPEAFITDRTIHVADTTDGTVNDEINSTDTYTNGRTGRNSSDVPTSLCLNLKMPIAGLLSSLKIV